MDVKRVFLIVLDSFGAGEAPDAAPTLSSTMRKTRRAFPGYAEFFCGSMAFPPCKIFTAFVVPVTGTDAGFSVFAVFRHLYRVSGRFARR